MKNLRIYHHISAKILAVSLILAVTVLTLINSYPAYAAENVIVLAIDGLRNDEAFDDPTHQYIPHIWNDLRPLGTINTNFWNTGVTTTTSGFTQMLSGVRPVLLAQLSAKIKNMSKYPDIFEYYRKQKNIPGGKVWLISGQSGVNDTNNYSLHPDYANLGASKECIFRQDPDTWLSVKQKMDTYHPSLMVINLASVDHQGHKGTHTDYTNAIKVADKIAYDLWQKIQKDLYYKDKTDLIIVPDHGRHSYNPSSHGDICHGCRHIMFLAIGPDFEQNQVVNMRRDQIDIAPTIGAILGVQTPYADGEVMTELFTDPNFGSNIVTGGQRRISISASGSGLHTVWSQKNGEEWDIYYKKSLDGGNTWAVPVKLFENGKDNNYFYEAKITSQDNGLVYVTAVGYSLENVWGDTYTWKVFGRRSIDGGNTWEGLQELEDAGILAVHPSIASDSKGDVLIIYSLRGPLKALYSIDQGITFVSYTVTDTQGKQEPDYSSVASDQNRFYTVWINGNANSTYKYWNVFFDSTDAEPMTWGIDKALTSNKRSNLRFYMNNSITINDSGLMKLLITTRADKTDLSGKIIAGKWKTLLKSSPDYGNTFIQEASFYTSNTYEAWNPKVSFIDPATGDYLVLWEQHYNGNGAEIYGRKKLSSGWQDVFPLSPLDGKDSAEPDLATYNGNAYVGWQDYETGSWQIKIKRIN